MIQHLNISETFFAQKKKRTVAGNTAGGHINPKRQFRTQGWVLTITYS